MILTSEDELFRDSVRRFVEKEMPAKAMREWARAGTFPEQVYRQWGEMGWLGIGLPGELGGSSEIQRNIIAHEMGL